MFKIFVKLTTFSWFNKDFINISSMIGTHNTFTYLKPIKWWMNLLTPFACCQKRLPENIEVFDIRVRSKDGFFYVSHGNVIYCRLYEAISMMQKACNKPICRILLEGKFTRQELELLEWILIQYKSIKFVCGRHKNGWEKLLTSLPDLDVEQYVGSMQSWYGKICPWLWWKLHKNKLKKLQDEIKLSNKYYLFDFI